MRTSDAEGGQEAGGHEAPVHDAEALLAGVEGQVGKSTLGVVVGRREAGAGSMEATLADQGGRGTGGGAGQHLLNQLAPTFGEGISSTLNELSGGRRE